MDVQRLLDEVRVHFDVRMYDHTTVGIRGLDSGTGRYIALYRGHCIQRYPHLTVPTPHYIHNSLYTEVATLQGVTLCTELEV